MDYIIDMHTVGGEPGLSGCVFSVDKNSYKIIMAALMGDIKLQVVPKEQKEDAETSADPEESTEA